ncbi:molybdopterin-synthase adenylyltransferase MoeB [Methyloligella sp. 2.7D]|uniref:HesA/MoeB/ThiF family protein n=1 Tax=unclassified Methyloligella TaxID=2625955 RepID=UPI00157CB23E|nr:molybdopterin-synthase adenylyltransferase MoeB [Methyloligella sp. GL2]QKP78626.1 molybdopterin-synthase adenylyltransferase MoeB [Methyloligella sp. GL2]
MLSDEEIQRYKRHLVLKEIGGQGQQQLKAARVLVIGAGGLGSPALTYLAAAGIGTLGIVDDDSVSLDNLQRQIIHGTEEVGKAKTESAAAAIARLNPNVATELHTTRLVPDNAMELIEAYDIVVDGSDNFATRYLVNDACFFAKRPLVFAALGSFDGHITTFRAFETDAKGKPRPNYRCLFPVPPPPGTVAPCAEAGILGAVAGVMGTLLAVETIKELTGIGESLVGRLLLYDALSSRFSTLTYDWDPENPLNGNALRFHDLSHFQNAPAL